MRRLMAQSGGGGTRTGAAAVRAFSLAELMIALGILGIGLLIIAAALPIGMQKTRDTAEQALGDAATAYALDVVAARLRLPRDVAGDQLSAPRRDNLFRPRVGSLPNFGKLAPDPVVPGREYEPWIKVRPLVTQNLWHTSRGTGSEPKPGTAFDTVNERIEGQIRGAVNRAWGKDDPWPLEAFAPEISPPIETGLSRFLYSPAPPAQRSGWLPPALSVLETVYPAVAPDPVLIKIGNRDVRFTQDEFFRSPDQRHGLRTRLPAESWEPPPGSEAEKALARRVSWVTFYRRLAYDTVNEGGTALVAPATRNLYEFIALAVVRPTDQHRFPVPHMRGASSWRLWNPKEPQFDPDKAALVPVPALVAFSRYDGWLTGGGSFANSAVEYLDNDLGRPMRPGSGRPTLRFECDERVGRLLPKGSIVIPAVNDDAPSLPVLYNPGLTSVANRRRSGFVPHASDVLPIYRVVDVVVPGRTNDPWVVVLEGNGFHPWTSNEDVYSWPVWVIPPAFVEVAGQGAARQPVFERRSPIISVARRVIALPEVP